MTAPGGRRQGGEGVAGGGTAALRGALLIGVAVVLGVVLLGKGLDNGIIPSSDDTPSQREDDEDGSDGAAAGGDEESTTTTTLAVARPAPEVKVLVLNGSGAAGVAGAGTDKAAAAGYQTAPAANVPEGQNVTASIIYFLEGYEADAQAVAGVLGVPLTETTIQPLPTPLPPSIPEGDIKGAHVVAVLGLDAPA